MSITDKLLRHLQDGRPLTALSAKQSYGVVDLRRALWNIRIRGYHISETWTTTISKYTGTPVKILEFRLGDPPTER